MIITVMLIVIAVVAYCLGSINGAIITSRYYFHSDIRDMGSGNAGLTNFYRNFGAKGLAMVLGIDVLKGVVAVLLGGWLLSLTGDYLVIGKLFAAFCLVLGHAYPVFYSFRGGKGILTGIAAVFCIDWRIGIVCIIVFLIAVFASRYISLGSILGAASFPISMMFYRYPWLAVLLSLFSVAIMLIRHRENIVRIITHSEPKFTFKKDIARKLDEDI